MNATRRFRVSGAQSVKVPETLNASSLRFLNVRKCLTIEWCQLKRRRGNLIELTRTKYALYKTLEHALIILKCMVLEHVLMNLVSFGKNIMLTNFETWQNNVCFGNQ